MRISIFTEVKILMKKFLLLTFVLLALTACGGSKKSVPTAITSNGVNLENCQVYFDGCNNCRVENGKITACTEMACTAEKIGKPVCLETIEEPSPIAVESVVLNANRSNHWYKTQCNDLGGLFFVNDQHSTKKCVGITAEECPAIGGGYYDDCASPCEYLPEFDPLCTQKCIGLCYISRDGKVEPPRELHGDPKKIKFEGFKPNELVSFPIFLNGKVDPIWSFEGVFGVKVLTERKKIITSHYATVNAWDPETGERITDKMIDFYGEVYAEPPENEMRGFIRFQRDNASGLPQNDDWVDIPVRFQ
jgi:hypothetical protein